MQFEDYALRSNAGDFASRSKAKTNPRRRESASSSTRTIPIRERTWTDVEPGKQSEEIDQCKHELEQIDVSKADKTKPERVLNSKEHTQFRGGVGSLGWCVDHCCPQLSFQVAELRRKQASPTIQDLLKLNTVIRAAKAIESKIKIRSIPVEHLRFMGVHDAAHANLEGGASQQGHLILAVHASITNCRVPVSVLSWQSKKIKRVVRSSLAAETCSVSTCQEHLDWMRTM